MVAAHPTERHLPTPLPPQLPPSPRSSLDPVHTNTSGHRSAKPRLPPKTGSISTRPGSFPFPLTETTRPVVQVRPPFYQQVRPPSIFPSPDSSNPPAKLAVRCSGGRFSIDFASNSSRGQGAHVFLVLDSSPLLPFLLLLFLATASKQNDKPVQAIFLDRWIVSVALYAASLVP